MLIREHQSVTRSVNQPVPTVVPSPRLASFRLLHFKTVTPRHTADSLLLYAARHGPPHADRLARSFNRMREVYEPVRGCARIRSRRTGSLPLRA